MRFKPGVVDVLKFRDRPPSDAAELTIVRNQVLVHCSCEGVPKGDVHVLKLGVAHRFGDGEEERQFAGVRVMLDGDAQLFNHLAVHGRQGMLSEFDVPTRR